MELHRRRLISERESSRDDLHDHTTIPRRKSRGATIAWQHRWLEKKLGEFDEDDLPDGGSGTTSVLQEAKRSLGLRAVRASFSRHSLARLPAVSCMSQEGSRVASKDVKISTPRTESRENLKIKRDNSPSQRSSKRGSEERMTAPRPPPGYVATSSGRFIKSPAPSSVSLADRSPEGRQKSWYTIPSGDIDSGPETPGGCSNGDSGPDTPGRGEPSGPQPSHLEDIRCSRALHIAVAQRRTLREQARDARRQRAHGQRSASVDAIEPDEEVAPKELPATIRARMRERAMSSDVLRGSPSSSKRTGKSKASPSRIGNLMTNGNASTMGVTGRK
ncbi:MAG: hypothetical protein SGPRY_009204, partial [Prymnesium sp.]